MAANEDVLLEDARRGDSEAFDGLARLHYEAIYSTAFHLVGNHEDAEDLSQECFVRAHRSLSFYRGEGSLRAWLRRILVHLARDRFRRKGRRPESAPLSAAAQVPGSQSPTGELTAKEFRLLLAEALGRLPDAQRIALVLRTLEGLDYREISNATGVTPATARTQVMKARKALARLLAPHVEWRDER